MKLFCTINANFYSSCRFEMLHLIFLVTCVLCSVGNWDKIVTIVLLLFLKFICLSYLLYKASQNAA
jgi:hypothetical protein